MAPRSALQTISQCAACGPLLCIIQLVLWSEMTEYPTQNYLITSPVHWGPRSQRPALHSNRCPLFSGRHDAAYRTRLFDHDRLLHRRTDKRPMEVAATTSADFNCGRTNMPAALSRKYTALFSNAPLDETHQQTMVIATQASPIQPSPCGGHLSLVNTDPIQIQQCGHIRSNTHIQSRLRGGGLD